MVSPLADGVDATWSKLLNGESGIDLIQGFDTSDLTAKIAGQVPMGTGAGEFNADTYLSSKERRRVDDFIV